MVLAKQNRREKIKRRIRKKISGTAKTPRLTVFRSNKQIFAQLIDDVTEKTLVSASSLNKDLVGQAGTKIEKSALVGKLIAERALESGISDVVFDRNGYLYHGRIKSLAEAAREAGLKF